MRIIKTRKKTIKTIALAVVLLIATILAVTSIQSQNQNTNPLIYQTLFPYMNSPVKTTVWSDKTVTGTETYSNEEIILNGNLTIANGGSLTLTNITLEVNCTYNGEHHIEVQSGGALYINDGDGNPNTINDASNITAYNPDYRFLFWVNSSSTFQMNNSELHYCGYGAPSLEYEGLWINTNNTIIENNTISDSCYPIILYYAYHNTIRNNNITKASDNFYLYSSSYNTLSGNTATGSFFLSSGSNNNTLSGNIATNGYGHGFFLYNNSNNNILTGNIATNNTIDGFHLWESSYNNLSGNTAINNSASGFVLQNSTYTTVTGNTAIHNTALDGFTVTSSWYNNVTGNTAASNKEYGFSLFNSSYNNLSGNTAINNTYGGFVLGGTDNYLTGSVLANYLRVESIDSIGSPILGTDVQVETDGKVVYATPWFGGSNSTTDLNGFTPWIAVPYRTYITNDTTTDNTTNVEVYRQNFSFLNNPRTVDISTTHTETFTAKAVPTVTITVPFSDSSLNFGSIYIIGYFNCTDSGFQSITCNDSRFDLLSSNLGDIGVFSFRNKTEIPTSDFWVNITVQDMLGLTSSKLRHIIVNQTLVEASITTEIGAGPNQQVNASASMGVELSLNLTKPISLSIVKTIENVGSSAPSGLIFLGRYFSIVVNDTTAIQGINITIHYTDQEITGIGLDENALAIWYWNETSGNWVELPSTVDTENNIVIAYMDHLTYFAILGTLSSEIVPPYLLLILLPQLTQSGLNPLVYLVPGLVAVVLVSLVLAYIRKSRPPIKHVEPPKPPGSRGRPLSGRRGS